MASDWVRIPFDGRMYATRDGREFFLGVPTRRRIDDGDDGDARFAVLSTPVKHPKIVRRLRALARRFAQFRRKA